MMQLLHSGVFWIISMLKDTKNHSTGNYSNIYRSLSREQFKKLETKIWQKDAVFPKTYTCRSCSSPWKMVMYNESQPHIFNQSFLGKRKVMCF